jgi:hypothetical protein
MGSFSWMRADRCTKRANLTMGDSYKILIPEYLGGGYIKDKYWDYGYINASEYDCAVYVDKSGKKWHKIKGEHDLHGLLAYMNRHDIDKKFYERLRDLSFLKDVKDDIMDIIINGDTSADNIRGIGIDIGCYEWEVNHLKYPLKLVSASFKGTYEDCDMVSYSDPEQGFTAKNWDSRGWYGRDTYKEIYEKNTKQMEKPNNF